MEPITNMTSWEDSRMTGCAFNVARFYQIENCLLRVTPTQPVIDELPFEPLEKSLERMRQVNNTNVCKAEPVLNVQSTDAFNYFKDNKPERPTHASMFELLQEICKFRMQVKTMTEAAAERAERRDQATLQRRKFYQI